MLERLLLNPREAAYKLGGISQRHLWNLTQPRGPIPCIRLGRRIFYSPAALEQFLENAARQQAAAAGQAEGQGDDNSQ